MTTRKPVTRHEPENAPNPKPRRTDYVITRAGDAWALKRGRRVVRTFATRDEAAVEARSLVQGTDTDVYLRSNSGRYLFQLHFSEAADLLVELLRERHERYLREGE